MRYAVYAASSDDSRRFALGTIGKRTLFVVGINPHKATQETSDRTASLVEKVSARNGYDSFVLLNLYPVRSRTVTDLPQSPDQSAIHENRHRITNFLAKHQQADLWVAWGNDILKRTFLVREAAYLAVIARSHGARCLHYGPLTKLGNPRHPSRLSFSWTFEPFTFPDRPNDGA